MARKTTKYLAALRTVKEAKLPIKNLDHSALYAALCKAGYNWNPDSASWEENSYADPKDPKTGLVKIRIIASSAYAVDLGEILEGMLTHKNFLKVDGPSISPSRKEEGFTLVCYTFKIPGYSRAFPNK